jgi:hypothetical protein
MDACPARARWLQASLDRAQGPARLWYFGWVSAYSAGLAVRTTLAFTSDDAGVRLDSRVGAVTIGIGLGVTLALTPRSLFAGDRLRGAPAGTLAESCLKVRFGESLLAEAAFWERAGKSWIAHVAGIAVNAGAGLYLGVKAQRWGSGLLAFAGGVTVTELKILTQPTTAGRALDADTPTVTLGLLPLGVALSGSF